VTLRLHAVENETINGELSCKKKVSDIPVPSRDVTYQTLPGREYVIKLLSPRGSLVVTYRLGMGMSLTFFYGVLSIAYVDGLQTFLCTSLILVVIKHRFSLCGLDLFPETRVFVTLSL
jgi:hypothetical protein